MRTPSIQHSRGFTLIEVLVVIAIMLLLLSISLDGPRLFSLRTQIDTSARQVIRALEEAHARTLSSDGATEYGVYFASTSVTVFPGSTYTEGDTDNTIYMITRSRITDVTLSDGTDHVVFTRLRGGTSATGTVTIADTRDASLTRTILIHQTGLAEIQ